MRKMEAIDDNEQQFKADNSYYNTGSCAYPRFITCIKITGSGKDMEISLIKWGVCDAADGWKGREKCGI